MPGVIPICLDMLINTCNNRRYEHRKDLAVGNILSLFMVVEEYSCWTGKNFRFRQRTGSGVLGEGGFCKKTQPVV